jgi:hypothetical protein
MVQKQVKYPQKDPRAKPAVRKLVALFKVQIDRSTQARDRKDDERVKALLEVLEDGKEFKDDLELYDDGFVYWVGDGFHRLDAYQLKGREKAWALVREGSHRDAMIHAAGANAEHGLPRKRKDIDRAIRLLLEDKEIGKLSDRAVAALARCTDKTVAARRRELGLNGGDRAYTDRHGNESVMDISGQRSRGKTLLSAGPVNAFHDLPVTTRRVLKGVLEEIGGLTKERYSFALSWLKGHLPPTPKEARELLTTLEAEEVVTPDDCPDGETDEEGGDLRF